MLQQGGQREAALDGGSEPSRGTEGQIGSTRHAGLFTSACLFSPSFLSAAVDQTVRLLLLFFFIIFSFEWNLPYSWLTDLWMFARSSVFFLHLSETLPFISPNPLYYSHFSVGYSLY